MRPTVVIIDDHDVFRDAARALLEAEGFDVVGTAPGAELGVSVVTQLRPDLVLVDIQLPRADGFEVARQIQNLPLPPLVVLISSRAASAYRGRLERAAARAFLAKHELSGSALRRLLE